MLRSDFFYELPKELIAQTPAVPRDSSRLMVYDRVGDKLSHNRFRDVINFLKSGDVLVVNNTKVLPARLFAGKTEVLLLKRVSGAVWECIARPAKKLKPGVVVVFSDRLSGTVRGVGDDGIRLMEFECDGVFEEVLDELGGMPLPPYITKKLEDKSLYQTVYSKILGSAAAPTAGLHFTPELLADLKAKGVTIVEVLLHVGLGTFRPVKTDTVEAHKMHSEHYEVTNESASVINDALSDGRRVIAVGTTSVRVLESAADDKGFLRAGCGETDIFIYPPYRFKAVSGMVTNFHLPESTLIMLVSAFVGREKTLELYKTAIAERYRFFSFGDAILLL